MASVEALATAEGKHHSSQRNFPACNRGLTRILHWRPNLRNSDSHQSKTLASAEELASAAALESAAALAWALGSAAELALARQQKGSHPISHPHKRHGARA